MDAHAMAPGGPAGAVRPEEPGLLITWVRRYNLLVTVIFAGRRGATDAALVRASGVRPGERVVDVGCGPGRFARRLADLVGPDGEVVGVDPSEPMIAYATRHSGRPEVCRFQQGTAQALELPDGAFDLVTTTFAMHHIAEDHRMTAITEMYRVLRPGGRVMIADAYPSGRVTPMVTRVLDRLFGRNGPGKHGHGKHDGQGRDSGNPDRLAAADVGQYEDAVRAAGFAVPRFADVPPWTRFLLAEKPGRAEPAGGGAKG